MSGPRLVENFFRHEYGRLVSTLVRRFGFTHIDLIEDGVQSSLIKALDVWTRDGEPHNPSAWVYRVACNEVMSALRTQSTRTRKLQEHAFETGDRFDPPAQAHFQEELDDDALRMLFVCCDEAIPAEAQLVMALKILCGFTVREISHRLFSTEAAVHKRFTRAKARLQEQGFSLQALTAEDYETRLPQVQKIIYLMFTEGYLSSHPETAIRFELCREAIRLGEILGNHRAGQSPQTYALLALMYLHMARMNAREAGSGGLLLLAEQDRRQWDRVLIATGLSWLSASAAGDGFSRYHAEAGIAAEHCLAPSFEETNWANIVEYYDLLDRTEPSALHRLNGAIALAELKGPEEGLRKIESIRPPAWLAQSYMWAAVQSDLHRRTGNVETADRYRQDAIDRAPTEAIKHALARRLG